MPLTAKQADVLVFSKKIIENKVNLASLEMKLTIQQTFNSIQIRSVFNGDAGVIGFGVVKILVTRFLNSFGFSTKLQEDQIEILTVDTLEHFGYESLEDIIIFFKMARSGKFGATKRGVDSNLIFGEWYPQYLDKKAQLRQQHYEQQKNKQVSLPPITMQDVALNYRKAMLHNLQERQSDFVDEFTKNMDRQMLEDTIISWSKDDKLKQHIDLLKFKRKTIKS